MTSIGNHIIEYIQDYSPEIFCCVFGAKWNESEKVQEKVMQVVDNVFDEHGKSDFIKASSSSGLVLILIFKNYVIKIASPSSYTKMKLAYNVLPSSDYLCEMFEANDQLYYTVEQVVIPIVEDGKLVSEYKDMVDQVSNDIQQAVKVFVEHGLCHADCRLDNVGYRPSTGTFVLFDYNSTRAITYDNPSDDFTTLENSINYHIG